MASQGKMGRPGGRPQKNFTLISAMGVIHVYNDYINQRNTRRNIMIKATLITLTLNDADGQPMLHQYFFNGHGIDICIETMVERLSDSLGEDLELLDHGALELELATAPKTPVYENMIDWLMD